jgi:hypothetical protein
MSADTHHDQSFADFMRSLGAGEIENGLPLTKLKVVEGIVSFHLRHGTSPRELIVHPGGRLDLFRAARMGEVDILAKTYMGLKVTADCSLSRSEFHLR